MTQIGFAEAYYDSFTGAQQSMAILIENSNTTNPILITPKYGECVESIPDTAAEKEIIEYPDRLDQFGGKLFSKGIVHKASVGGNLLWYYLTVARKLYRLDIDVLYCNNIRSLMLFGPPAKALNIPVIWYVRIDTPTPPLDHLALRLSDEVITISNGVRHRFDEDLLKVYDDHIQTIYTGVDLERFDPDRSYGNPYNIDSEPLTIVEVASIHPRKGQHKIINAVTQVQDDLPDFQLVFAGSVAEGQQAYSEKIHHQVQKANLEEEVTFLGWCDDVRGVLSQADIFVLPSENEGFPRSILEASAMGVPTIATPAGGTTELLRHEETGLVIPMNDVKELASAIQKLALEPKLRESYGNNARSLVKENFSQTAYVMNFEQLLSEMFSPE